MVTNDDDCDDYSEQLLAQMTPSRRTIMIITSSSSKRRNEKNHHHDDDDHHHHPQDDYNTLRTTTNNTKEGLEWFRACRDRWKNTPRKAIQPILRTPIMTAEQQQSSESSHPNNNVQKNTQYQTTTTPQNIPAAVNNSFASPFTSSQFGFHASTTTRTSTPTKEPSERLAPESFNGSAFVSTVVNTAETPSFTSERNDTFTHNNLSHEPFHVSFGNGVGMEAETVSNNNGISIFGSTFGATSMTQTASTPHGNGFSFQDIAAHANNTGWGRENLSTVTTGFSCNTPQFQPTSTSTQIQATTKLSNENIFRGSASDSSSSSSSDHEYDPDEDYFSSSEEDEDDDDYDDDEYDDEEDYYHDEEQFDNKDSNDDDIRDQIETPSKNDEIDGGHSRSQEMLTSSVLDFSSPSLEGLSMEPKSSSIELPHQVNSEATTCSTDTGNIVPTDNGQEDTMPQVTSFASAQIDHSTFPTVKGPCNPLSGWNLSAMESNESIEPPSITKWHDVQAHDEIVCDEVQSPQTTQHGPFGCDRHAEFESDPLETPLVSNLSKTEMPDGAKAKYSVDNLLIGEMDDHPAIDLDSSRPDHNFERNISDIPDISDHLPEGEDEPSDYMETPDFSGEKFVVEISDALINNKKDDSPLDEDGTRTEKSLSEIPQDIIADTLPISQNAEIQHFSTEVATQESANKLPTCLHRKHEESYSPKIADILQSKHEEGTSAGGAGTSVQQKVPHHAEITVCARSCGEMAEASPKPSLSMEPDEYTSKESNDGVDSGNPVGQDNQTDEVSDAQKGMTKEQMPVPEENVSSPLMLTEDFPHDNHNLLDTKVPLAGDAQNTNVLETSPREVVSEEQYRENIVELSASESDSSDHISCIRGSETPKVSNTSESPGECLPESCLVSCSNEILEFVCEEFCSNNKPEIPPDQEGHPSPLSDVMLKASSDGSGFTFSKKEELLLNDCDTAPCIPLQQTYPDSIARDRLPVDAVSDVHSYSVAQDDAAANGKGRNPPDHLCSSNDVQNNGVDATSEQESWKMDEDRTKEPKTCLQTEQLVQLDNMDDANSPKCIASNLNEEGNANFVAFNENNDSTSEAQPNRQGKLFNNAPDKVTIEISDLVEQTSCSNNNVDLVAQGKTRLGTRKIAVSPGRLSTSSSPSRSVKTGTSSFESLSESIEILQQDLDDSMEKIEHMKQKLDEEQQKILDNRPRTRAEAVLASIPRTLLPSESAMQKTAADDPKEHSKLNIIEEETQNTSFP